MHSILPLSLYILFANCLGLSGLSIGLLCYSWLISLLWGPFFYSIIVLQIVSPFLILCKTHYLYLCFFIHLSIYTVCLSVYLYFPLTHPPHLSPAPHIYVIMCLWIYKYKFVYLSINLPIYLFILDQGNHTTKNNAQLYRKFKNK